MTDKVQKIREKVVWLMSNHDSALDYEAALEDVLNIIDSLQEEPVSTKDKLLALSDGRLHLGWIDDAKVVEFEECLMQFHKDMSNIPQDTDSLIRLKDTDGVLHGYSKKLMFMAKEEPVSEDLEEAADKYESEQQEKYKDRDNHDFDNYRDGFVDGLTHTYEAFMSGAKWRKGHLWKPADGDDLPEIDREVIALLDNGKVVFAHRPQEYWDGKNIITGKVTRNYPKTYDKGGWNISDVKFWLDVELPKEIEL